MEIDSTKMEVACKQYQLSCHLPGHEDDVRGIVVCGNAGFATSSRDRTVRFWSSEKEKRSFEPSKILLGHTSFVGPLAWISPDDEFPEGRIVSGGMDTLVLVWDLSTAERVQTLKGHQLQVSGVALDDNGDVISSSLDRTIKRWRKGVAIESWEAHESAVLAVLKLSSGELVTGSSDMTLKLWRGKECLHTFKGHTDTVRALCVMPGFGILSASHDGTIRLWALTGQVLMEMVGHTSVVYSVDSHVSGLIVSGSEDCSAKIWKDGVCIQSIEHPGCVWDATFLENGDIITACSDNIVRIWTLDQDRVADPVDCDAYVSQVSQYKISRKRVGGLKLEELPGLEAFQIPGTTDCQMKIVREGDNGVAYSWNVREQKWDKIGEVVDGMKIRTSEGIEVGMVTRRSGAVHCVKNSPFEPDTGYASPGVTDTVTTLFGDPKESGSGALDFVKSDDAKMHFVEDTNFDEEDSMFKGDISVEEGMLSWETHKESFTGDLSKDEMISWEEGNKEVFSGDGSKEVVFADDGSKEVFAGNEDMFAGDVKEEKMLSWETDKDKFTGDGPEVFTDDGSKEIFAGETPVLKTPENE